MVEWKSIKITIEDYNKLILLDGSPSKAINRLLVDHVNKENNKKLTDETFLKEMEKTIIDTSKIKLSMQDIRENIDKIEEVIQRVVKINNLKYY